MRVLHLFDEYLNTTENWAFRLIDSLRQCRIYIGAPVFLRNNFYKSKFNYFTYPLESLYRKVKESEKGSLANIFFRLLFELNKFFFGSFAHYLRKKTKSENIQIIHSHFSFVGYSYLGLSRKLKIPHVVSFYGFDYEWLPFNYPEWKNRYKTLFKEADIFICEGTNSAKLLERSGCDASKIRVVSLGVNPEKIKFYSRKKESNRLKLLQVASFTEKKGHSNCIKAFAMALHNCPDMTLTLVGKNQEGIDGTEEEIRKLIIQLSLEDKVNIIGMIDFENLHSFMRNYDVFIHPSCTTVKKDCEGGAPVVLLDAQVTGMPVISTKHCDIPDEVWDGKSGLLSEESDIKQIAENIERFYRMDQEEYDFFSKNAREHMVQNFDINKNAKDLEKIYQEVLGISAIYPEAKGNKVPKSLVN